MSDAVSVIRDMRGGVSEEVLAKLAVPFMACDIEWRVQNAGKTNGRVWASVLAYVQNRAIMNRLDEVVGPGYWQNTFQIVPGGMLCGLGILVDGEWVWKYDGAQETEYEPFKGGLSGAMKRAAVQWGIGRYLYNLESTYPKISMEKVHGWHRDRTPEKAGGEVFWWEEPTLPSWALPGGQAAMASAPQLAPSAPPSPAEGVVSLEDMQAAEERAQVNGISPGQFKMAFIVSTGKTTAKNRIDYKRLTKQEYDAVWAALESVDAVNRFINACPASNL